MPAYDVALEIDRDDHRSAFQHRRVFLIRETDAVLDLVGIDIRCQTEDLVVRQIGLDLREHEREQVVDLADTHTADLLEQDLHDIPHAARPGIVITDPLADPAVGDRLDPRKRLLARALRQLVIGQAKMSGRIFCNMVEFFDFPFFDIDRDAADRVHHIGDRFEIEQDVLLRIDVERLVQHRDRHLRPAVRMRVGGLLIGVRIAHLQERIAVD